MSDSGKSVVGEYQSKVASVLESKNIQNMPRTIASLLSELSYAEKFAQNYLETFEKENVYAENRIIKTCVRIDKVLSGLASRDHKTQAESLKENELDNEALYKRALLHTFKVQKAGDFRKYASETQANLDNAVESSLQKVPFSQRDAFRALLVQLQGVEDDGSVTE